MKFGSINLRQYLAKVNRSFRLQENPLGDWRHKSSVQAVQLIPQEAVGSQECDRAVTDMSDGTLLVPRAEFPRWQAT